MSNAAGGEVYIAPAIAAVRALYRDLFTAEFWHLDIGEQIERQAQVLQRAQAAGNPAARFQIQSWMPGAAHKPWETIRAEPFTLDQARTVVAREYGYTDGCEALERGGQPPGLSRTCLIGGG